MNIGVDIDGVLADVQKFERTFNVPKAGDDEFWARHIWDYTPNVEVIKGAAAGVTKLRNDGHKIIINTARDLCDKEDEQSEKMRTLVCEWLAKHKIPYDEIRFSQRHDGNKLRVAKECALDIHIDDSPAEIERLVPFIPVIIFDAPYNKDLNPPNTYRAKNWHEVYNTITNFSSNPATAKKAQTGRPPRR